MTTPNSNKKPAILHVISDLGDGGAQSSLYLLCTRDLGHRHHVVSLMGGSKYGPLLEERGVSVTCIGMKRGQVSLSGLWRLWRLIRQTRPDVIQTWMYHADLVGGVVARLAGQRNIVWGIHHTTLVPGESARSTILVSRLCGCLSRLVPRRIVCCAEKSREVHAVLGYDRARMAVIPNGYDLSVFRPDAQAGQLVRRELSLGPAEPVIGFVARFDPLKDHETLLRALEILKSQVKRPHCLLVGTGLDAGNGSITSRIAALSLQDQVSLLGQRNDIPAVMSALDLHVMSSVGEAFPNVLAEAMACGTPCVSTDVGDAAVIIGATGRIVPPRNPEALATAISDMFAERGSPAWPQRCKAARRHVADHFSIQRMVESYRNVWFDRVEHTAPAPTSQEFME